MPGNFSRALTHWEREEERDGKIIRSAAASILFFIQITNVVPRSQLISTLKISRDKTRVGGRLVMPRRGDEQLSGSAYIPDAAAYSGALEMLSSYDSTKTKRVLLESCTAGGICVYRSRKLRQRRYVRNTLIRSSNIN